MDLNSVWFLLVGVLVIGYAILDGFDFGVGALSLFAKSEDERTLMMNSIAPVWDGNEVWLLTGGGALFAAFPIVYATVFSAYYLALMLLLAFLILRAVSLEFRNKVDSPAWRRGWDVAFGVGSVVPPILFGVAFGNVLHGLPLDQGGTFRGTFLGLLNPQSVLCGVLALVAFLMHGSIWLSMKTEGALQERMVRWAPRFWIGTVVAWLAASVATLFVAPHLFAGLLRDWVFWAVFLGLLIAVIGVPVALHSRRFGTAFVLSATAIAGVAGLAGVSLFPWLVPSSIDLAYSLDIYNAASTPRTQLTMLIIALIGVPIVLVYTAMIYRVFRGKVKLTDGYH